MIKRCSHYPTLIGTIEGVNYYCSDLGGVGSFSGNAIVNLTGVGNVPNPANVPPELAKHIENDIYELVIPWADFGLPKVKSSFWQALHSYIVSMGWTEVCIHCEGGHGRTGTAMASIMITVLGWSVGEAVEYLRDNYCKDAVETSNQCEYLCILDIEYNQRQLKEDEVPIPSFYINDDDGAIVIKNNNSEDDDDGQST